MSAQTPNYNGPNAKPAHDLKDKATEQLGLMADAAADKLQDVAGQAEQFAGRVVEQGREVGGQVQAVAGNLKDAVDKSVRDQPMATIVIAAALGFVLGALWKS